ncbi:MAG: LysR family transcriptional regulator [Chromatiales bacterium]|nr:LysR family transcriptional regulator [Chromatiales bacterium]
MNLQQLRIVRETVRRQFNLTEVANALFTAQSGVSKHIKDLEDELGVELFARRGKRLLGLTAPGLELLPIVERILLDLAEHQATGRAVRATGHRTSGRRHHPHPGPLCPAAGGDTLQVTLSQGPSGAASVRPGRDRRASALR